MLLWCGIYQMLVDMLLQCRLCCAVCGKSGGVYVLLWVAASSSVVMSPSGNNTTLLLSLMRRSLWTNQHHKLVDAEGGYFTDISHFEEGLQRTTLQAINSSLFL